MKTLFKSCAVFAAFFCWLMMVTGDMTEQFFMKTVITLLILLIGAALRRERVTVI